MRRAHRRSGLLLAAILLLVAGCAAGRSAADPVVPDDAVEVRVRNNLTPRTLVTVRIFSGSGTRTFLGAVAPGDTKSLTFREAMFESRYQLVATGEDGQEIRSRDFDMYLGARVVWTLKTNVLDIGPR